MLNIGRGWLVPVTMLNIRRGRRREHPMDISKGVTTGVAQLPVAHGTPNGTPKGVKWPSVAMLLLLRKKRGKKPGMRRTYSRSGLLPDRSSSGHVTLSSSSQKAPLGRIWHNFRTWHVTDVTSCHVTDVTSGHVTSGHAQWSDPPHDPPQMWLELYPYTTDRHWLNR